MIHCVKKPTQLFDRDWEWLVLDEFCSSTTRHPTLAVITGRRRQGKTHLAESRAELDGGFVFTALEETERSTLDRLGAEWGNYLGLGAAVRFDSWPDALAALLSAGAVRNRPTTVVFDEFGFAATAQPALPSMLQALLSPARLRASTSATRLILCGSAVGLMSRLTAPQAPLRGRTQLELVLQPFGYRTSAGFWGLDGDPATAFKLFALLGGTPAYRDYVDGRAPTAPTFDTWVAQRLLSPASPLFREGRLVVAEDPSVGDAALFWSVLDAIARGKTRRSEIGTAIGRSAAALTHPLQLLEEVRLIRRVQDAFLDRRPTYHLDDPLVRFHALLIRPNEARLNRRQGAAVWRQQQPTVRSHIYGPEFENLARVWTLEHASEQTLRGQAVAVGPGTRSDHRNRTSAQIDIVACNDRGRVLAIGEAKYRSVPVGVGELNRLRIFSEPLSDHGPVNLLLFGASGFTSALRQQAATRTDAGGHVELVDMPRLYRGD